jgi:predicted transcriptional regulator
LVKIPRRDKLKLYGDLLTILYNEREKENIVLTKVQVQLQVPYDRLKKYIKEIYELELIDGETSLNVTEKGLEYLREYKKILAFMRKIGLTYQ